MESEWKTYRLGDISKLRYGKLPPIDTNEGQYPIFSGYRIVGYTSSYNCSSNTPIVVARGVGGTGDVKLLKQNCYLTNLAISVDIDENICTAKYFYYMHLLHNLKWLDSGAAQSQITIDDLSRLKLSLPPISKQNRITSILSSYDDLIENNNRRIKILEQMAENLYKEWFVRFRFPGHEQAEFENGMPKGWEIRRFSDNIAKITAGGDRPEVYSPYKSDICTVPIFANGTDDYGLYGYTNHPKIYEESVTVSARGTVGYVCLREEPYVPIVRLLSLVPVDKEISAKFIYYALKTDCIEGNGTSQQQMTVPMFGRKKILIPDRKLIAKFTAIVDDLFSLRRNHMIANQNLTKQRDMLLPRLMNGKLEV